MKIMKITGIAIATALVTVSSFAGVVTIGSTAPSTDIVSSTVGDIDSAIFDENANANHSRGQVFSLAGGSGTEYQITALTIQKSTAQAYINDTFTLRIFEGTETQWDKGTGHSTGTDGTDYLVDTGVTLLHTEAFTLNGAIADEDFVTLTLSSPITITIDEYNDFGFFFTYDQVGGTQDRFRYNEGGAGGRISITTSDHGLSGRQMEYYLQGTSDATFSLGSPFQDGMIVQRDKPITVWGWADAGTVMTIEMDDNSVTATADAQGAWSADLSAMPYVANESYVMNISTGGKTNTLNDVLVGDVWITFGQSNMVQDLDALDNGDVYINDIVNNDLPIRCLQIKQDAALTPQETGDMTWHDHSDSPGDWTSVGTIFAYENYKKTGVPNAIVWAAWGSSSIEGWMPIGMTNDFPHFEAMAEIYQSIGEYNNGVPVATRATNAGYSTNLEYITALINGEATWNTSADIFIRTRPNIIYNQMIHPLLKYDISGFVWYQGEANAGTAANAEQYGEMLPAFVTDYRSLFNEGDLAFFGVQLPSYNATYWPWFRESQDQLLTLNNAYVAVAIDTGLSGNIHPQDKAPIGERLSLLARKYVLGESIEAHGPTYASMSVSGSAATISYTSNTGLTTDDASPPSAFEVAGTDGVYYDATATISGTDVVISSSSVTTPVNIRYAWLPYAKDSINLVNGDGLPAAPFRTDSPWIDTPPAFYTNPFSKPDAMVSVEYSGSLSDSVYGGSGNLVFSNLTAGSWLTIGADGSLSGVPSAGDEGTIILSSVMVTDDIGRTDTAMLTIGVVGYVAPNNADYIDTFDADGLDVNSGSGGGLVNATINALAFSDDGDLSATKSSSGAQRAAVYSENTFSVTEGFTLEVTYHVTLADSGTLADTATFGLIEFIEQTNLDGLFVDNRFAQTGIGMSLTPKNSLQGLVQVNATDAGSDIELLSAAPAIADATEQTCTLTVTNGMFSYSIDGATPSTGTTSFDLSKEYHFAAFTQRNAGFTIKSVSLIPIKIITEIGEITMDLSGGGGTNANFSWYGQNGATYELQTRESLTDGDWASITNIPGADADIILTDEMDQTNGFYRIKLTE